MQKENGCFNNYMNYERTVIKDPSEDAYGRVIWAIGHLIRFAPSDSFFQMGMQIWEKSIVHLDNLVYARGYANCIIGLYHYIRRFPDQERFRKLLVMLSNKLVEKFKQHSHENWNWFEDSLTYDNGLLPASLYKSYSITSDPVYLEIADKSRIFLESKCMNNDWLSLIGNSRWLQLDKEYYMFAQQPIDAMAMIMMYESAFKATGNTEFVQRLLVSFDWFFGRNDLNVSLFDHETKGCNDGIEEFNINRNQGAESNIAYLISWLITEPYRVSNA